MNLITELRRLGWSIEERLACPVQLPPEVSARYPRLPATLVAFLSGVVTCVNPSETTWFLCEADFYETSESAFRWNEWELISLEAADGDDHLRSSVRAFWDNHFPFLLSVADGYSYHAIDTSSEGFGRVIMGREPEFEEAKVVAESFEQFLVELVKGAGSI
ncbi:MAG: SMI1/KNR4 family protein [Proteobacteria bacterium]|nr:SMI1/KNR4 family protein [Pseudomonadota bacterium]